MRWEWGHSTGVLAVGLVVILGRLALPVECSIPERRVARALRSATGDRGEPPSIGLIVPYADAAALMLAHLSPSGAMSRHRVGLALPVGMRGEKEQWTAGPGVA